jgi:hypothetical protein
MRNLFLAISLAAAVAGCAGTNSPSTGGDQGDLPAINSKETVTGSNIPKKDRTGSRVITVDPESMQGPKGPSKTTGGG